MNILSHATNSSECNSQGCRCGCGVVEPASNIEEVVMLELLVENEVRLGSRDDDAAAEDQDDVFWHHRNR